MSFFDSLELSTLGYFVKKKGSKSGYIFFFSSVWRIRGDYQVAARTTMLSLPIIRESNSLTYFDILLYL